MASINYAAREISVKIVYYGPGLSGKTTNLQIIHRKIPKEYKSEMVSLATETDRTLFFDFLPLNLGKIKGFSAKFQLYTVPGQVYYSVTRKLVLRGVDGIVFVADSAADKMNENLESFQNMEENLSEYGYKREEIPIILQYNKRDLPNALPVDELNMRLNKFNSPFCEAIANRGDGVFDTLKLMGKTVIDELNRRYSRQPARSAAPAPRPSAPAAFAPQPQQMPQPSRPAPQFQPPPQSMPRPAPAVHPAQPLGPSPFAPAPAPQQFMPQPPATSPTFAAPANPAVGGVYSTNRNISDTDAYAQVTPPPDKNELEQEIERYHQEIAGTPPPPPANQWQYAQQQQQPPQQYQAYPAPAQPIAPPPMPRQPMANMPASPFQKSSNPDFEVHSASDFSYQQPSPASQAPMPPNPAMNQTAPGHSAFTGPTSAAPLAQNKQQNDGSYFVIREDDKRGRRTDRFEDAPEKKKGFFGRLFG